MICQENDIPRIEVKRKISSDGNATDMQVSRRIDTRHHLKHHKEMKEQKKTEMVIIEEKSSVIQVNEDQTTPTRNFSIELEEFPRESVDFEQVKLMTQKTKEIKLALLESLKEEKTMKKKRDEASK